MGHCRNGARCKFSHNGAPPGDGYVQSYHHEVRPALCGLAHAPCVVFFSFSCGRERRTPSSKSCVHAIFLIFRPREPHTPRMGLPSHSTPPTPSLPGVPHHPVPRHGCRRRLTPSFPRSPKADMRRPSHDSKFKSNPNPNLNPNRRPDAPPARWLPVP